MIIIFMCFFFLGCLPDYWHGLLGMKVYSQKDNMATLGFADNQVHNVVYEFLICFMACFF